MMTGVDRTALAIQTLCDVDPEFNALVGMLYGDDDPDLVIGDVTKANPDTADVNSKSSLKRRLAFAGTVAGGVLGVKELKDEAPELARAVRAKKGVLVPARRVGIATTALGADALAGSELDPRKPKQPVEKLYTEHRIRSDGKVEWRNDDGFRGVDTQPPPDSKQVRSFSRVVGGSGSVEKLSAPSVADMATGLRSKLTRTAGSLFPKADRAAKPGSVPLPGKTPIPKPTMEGNNPKAMGNAQQFTAGVLGAAGTPAGKTLIGGGLVASALKHRQNKNNASQVPMGPPGQDPNVGKSIEWQGTFSKVDLDKQQVFGWASVVKINGMPVDDAQDDRIDEADLEEAAYHYVLNSRVGGHMHRRSTGKSWFGDDTPHHVSDLIESMVFTDEKIHKMGLPDSFPRGWWAGYQINDPDVWEDVKKGKLAGFSIHGKGKREEIPMDMAMGW